MAHPDESGPSRPGNLLISNGLPTFEPGALAIAKCYSVEDPVQLVAPWSLQDTRSAANAVAYFKLNATVLDPVASPPVQTWEDRVDFDYLGQIYQSGALELHFPPPEVVASLQISYEAGYSNVVGGNPTAWIVTGGKTVLAVTCDEDGDFRRPVNGRCLPKQDDNPHDAPFNGTGSSTISSALYLSNEEFPLEEGFVSEEDKTTGFHTHTDTYYYKLQGTGEDARCVPDYGIASHTWYMHVALGPDRPGSEYECYREGSDNNSGPVPGTYKYSDRINYRILNLIPFEDQSAMERCMWADTGETLENTWDSMPWVHEEDIVPQSAILFPYCYVLEEETNEDVCGLMEGLYDEECGETCDTTHAESCEETELNSVCSMIPARIEVFIHGQFVTQVIGHHGHDKGQIHVDIEV